jgi:hypothetical protein
VGKTFNKITLEEKILKGINFIGGMSLQYIPIKENKNLSPGYDINLKGYYSL